MKKLLFSIISVTTVLAIVAVFLFIGNLPSRDANSTETTAAQSTMSESSSAEPKTIPSTSAPNTTAVQATTKGTAVTQAATQVMQTQPTDAVTSMVTNTVMLADFPVQSQLPELPTGCEITSLSMVLNYNGFAADKCDLADNYLTKGETGTVNFRKAFLGNPRDDTNSYGCYAPVIVEAANKYLATQQSSLKAVNIIGAEPEDLFPYIDAGVPVIVWGTRFCEEAQSTTVWNVDGETLTWIYPEHCMVLVGYDDNMIYEADPLTGTVDSYDIEVFRRGYHSLYQQAVIIQ